MPVESPFIVRAETVKAHVSARAIVADAESEAQRIRTSVDAERTAALDEARREGLRQGLEEAAAVAARTTEAIEDFWQTRDAELRDVALAVAHRVLSSLPADEVMLRLATEAVAEHAQDSRLELRAAPETAEVLRSALRDGPAGDRVTVTADPTLPRDACALLHPRGRCEIGLLAQFRNLMTTPHTAGEGSTS